jgi:CBS domain-containing protein
MKAATQQGTLKPFLNLTAADLMTAPVMTIPHDTSLREAARLLSGSHVSGAPVVDADGHCLGVLSSSDFVTWASEEESAAGEISRTTCFIAPWGEMIDIEESADNAIQHYMKAPLITVALTTPVGEVAQKMVDAHIHRVLVVVEDDLPRGIVTSTDILAAVGAAARGSSHHGAKR